MTLSAPIRRLAALALLFAVLWTGWGTLVSPMLNSLSADQRSISRSLQVLAHYRELASSEPTLERQRAMLLSTARDKELLQGADPSAVAAEIQAMARNLVVKAGAVVRVSRALPGADVGRFRKGEVSLDLQASVASLRRLLHSLASNQPAVLVEKLAIHTPEDGTIAAAADRDVLVDVQLQLASYALNSKVITATK